MFYKAAFIECIQKSYNSYSGRPSGKKERKVGRREEGKGEKKRKKRDTYSDEILFTPLDAFVWPQGNI